MIDVNANLGHRYAAWLRRMDFGWASRFGRRRMIVADDSTRMDPEKIRDQAMVCCCDMQASIL